MALRKTMKPLIVAKGFLSLGFLSIVLGCSIALSSLENAFIDNIYCQAIARIMADKVYTSAEFKRERDNFHVSRKFEILLRAISFKSKVK